MNVMNERLLQRFGSAMRMLPPGFPGKTRLARRLMPPASGVQDLLVECLDGMRLLVPSLSESVGFHLFIDGVYEPAGLDWALAHLQPGDVFLDIGANIGAFAIPAARRVGPSGRVIAVEASPRISEYLVKNIALNQLDNVAICRIAAGDMTGTTPFFEAPVERFGMGSLTAEHGGTPTLVEIRMIDDLLAELHVERVNVLKIDIEGFEYGAFKGAERLLRSRQCPLVLFEFYDWAERAARQPGDAQRFLIDCGYRIWTLEDHRRGRAALPHVLTADGGNLVAVRGAAA